MHPRPLAAADIPRLSELNDAAYPAVPITPVAEMTQLLDAADFTFAATDASDELVGFVIGMRPGNDYDSENYRFFESRGTDFLYVDRIVIDEEARGGGLGRMLYAAVFDRARAEGRTEVTCEVNISPPNPGSLAFHARLGFERVGEQSTKGGSVTVALLAAAL
ncbi:GNAT family N-acetyltransferase [Glaciihabitans sp. UYNi722]|uniref:GNAT family N-acetyltransferase n=1 Tax=Glaciihabitans sp. UYNi722 TaxID=3156344 RepID=UPI0033978ABE